MAYQKVSPTQANNEVVDIAESKGQQTEGVYLGAREIPFGMKEDGVTPDIRTIVDMQGPLGPEDVFSFWASTAIKMTLPQVAIGSRIRLTYLGKQKNPKTNRTFKAFDIEVDDGEPEPVSAGKKSSAGSGVRV